MIEIERALENRRFSSAALGLNLCRYSFTPPIQPSSPGGLRDRLPISEYGREREAHDIRKLRGKGVVIRWKSQIAANHHGAVPAH